DAVAANPSNLGDPATIDNSSNPTISGLNAKFTAPNQSVTYTFYARNTGEFLAYLNYITFANVEGASSNKVCTASDGTSQALVDQACNGISMSVKVGNLEAVTTSQSSIQNHTLATNTSEVVTVTISYAENAALADGAFNVSFGDVSLIYSSINDYIVEETEPICTAVETPTIGNVPAGNYAAGDEYVCDVNDTDSYNFVVVNSTDTTVSLVMTTTLGVTQYITNEKYLELGGQDYSTDEAYCQWENKCAGNEFGPVTALSLTDDWDKIENISLPSESDVVPEFCLFNSLDEEACASSWALKLPSMWLSDSNSNVENMYSIPTVASNFIHIDVSHVNNEQGFSPKITVSKDQIG
ncbi:MAG: hypothetical protein IKL65_03300, partial [Bacilli bacterium]|nr:hypothetical protein [Bacilli bacterium]